MFIRLLFTLAVLPMPFVSAASLTITNENLALVRDPIQLSLKSGENTVIHSPVPPGIDPNSILLLPETSGEIDILQQGFEQNTPSRDRLLRKFEGEDLQFLVKEHEKPDRVITAKLLVANGDSSLVSLENSVRFGLPGQPLFSEFPTDTRLGPSIVWTLASASTTTTNATVAYLTTGLNWAADYAMVSRADSELVDLTAMVSITNESNRDFVDAEVKLMAGAISFLAEHSWMPRPKAVDSMPGAVSSPFRRSA